MKIARIATVPFFLQNHLSLQIKKLASSGYEVFLLSSAGPEVSKLKKIDDVSFIEVNIVRGISPVKDLISLWRLYWCFRRRKFDIVHTTTPKAGTLGALAAFVARVPIRLHTFTGQPWAEMSGVKRELVKFGDKLTAALNTRCYADSFSQRDFLVKEHIALKSRFRVLGEGSLAGVDLERFSGVVPSPERQRRLIALQIPVNHHVIAFIGRITADKGIKELIESFKLLQEKGAACTLLLIGPEEQDAKQLYIASGIDRLKNVRRLGYQSNPEYWLSLTDVFCLPSYREGFGNVVIEAAAMGVPTVGTDIPGLRDAVVHEETGILVPPKDVAALSRALEILIEDSSLRNRMGLKAQKRVREQFDASKVNALLIAEYHLLHREFIP